VGIEVLTAASGLILALIAWALLSNQPRAFAVTGR
jgi:hypothetical protein